MEKANPEESDRAYYMRSAAVNAVAEAQEWNKWLARLILKKKQHPARYMGTVRPVPADEASVIRLLPVWDGVLTDALPASVPA